ncbi:MAG: hypothetical protein ACLTDR_11740 [Adlercreutzia equolifaciens]
MANQDRALGHPGRQGPSRRRGSPSPSMGLKRADANLDWKGTEAGGKAARESNEGYTVLKGTLANLASTAVTAAVGGIRDAASAVVEIGSAFESSMSKVSALSGATGDDLAALESKARELGSSTTFSSRPRPPTPWDTWRSPDGTPRPCWRAWGRCCRSPRRASSTSPPPPTS